MNDPAQIELPGLDCGLCGYRTCDEFGAKLKESPDLARRCLHLSKEHLPKTSAASRGASPAMAAAACAACSERCSAAAAVKNQKPWHDSLDRPFDFYLEHFPEDPGPREIIKPHNVMLTRELDMQVGDLLIGRPLGMSCGCPITHCGVVVQVDKKTGVMTWCVTGPLGPRGHAHKDIGYYSAEGYEGLVRETRSVLQVGRRYWFQPRMCMLQWRHSGLLNYLSRNSDGYQVRLEGLWIG